MRSVFSERQTQPTDSSTHSRSCPDLIQVAGQTVVQVLHGLLVVGAVAVHAVHLHHRGPVQILAHGGHAAQRAAGDERDRGAGASAAGVHQGAAGEGGLAAGGVTPHRDAGGHGGRLLRRTEMKMTAEKNGTITGVTSIAA